MRKYPEEVEWSNSLLTGLPREYASFSDVTFNSEDVNSLLPEYVAFANTESGRVLLPTVDKVGQLIDKLKRPETDKAVIRKAFLMGFVLHQCNSSDPQKKNFRGHEFAPNGIQYPYSIHLGRVMLNALGMDLDTDALIAAALHDTKEDVAIQNGEKVMKGEDLIALTAQEFPDYPQSAMLIDILSNAREDMTEQDRIDVRNSRIYEIARQKYVERLRRTNKVHEFMGEKGQAEIDRIIQKAVYGIARIIHKAREYAGEDDELFFNLVVKSFLLKGLDAYDNMGSKGMRPPSFLRNRVIIHACRILGTPLADKLMKRLIRMDPEDPFNPSETLKHIDKQMNSKKTQEELEQLRLLLAEMKLPGSVSTRYQVSIADETTINPAHQVVIETDGGVIDHLEAALRYRLRTIFPPAKASNNVFLSPVTGFVHKIMSANGRRFKMFEVLESTEMHGNRQEQAMHCYIRINGSHLYSSSDLPDGWEFARYNAPSMSFHTFPEASIFYVPPGASLLEALEVVSSIYHPQEDDYNRMMEYSAQKRATE